MKERTLTNLMEMAIRIDGPIKVKHFNGQVVLLDAKINLDDGCYEINNGVVAFIENKILYVIPYFKAVVETLQANGFVQKAMYVPFSNGDSPYILENKWKSLLIEAHKQRTDEFIADCERVSDEMGCRPIPKELLQKCFEIPVSGIHVKHPYWDSTIYPEITGTNLDCISSKKLGRYNTNNGTCVFVYRNGKTYVTKNWDVVEALRENGYQQGPLYVPLSNGETIIDQFYAERWADFLS